MREIAPGIIYLTRQDWGAHAAYPRLGGRIAPADRVEAIHHHTVIIDNDATPNLWETLDEVKAKMRQLQVIRPDLGLDVPYNFVAFLMADGTIVLCEGRGAHRRGAHTKYHNRTGMAIAIEGNLELQVDVGRFVEGLSHAWGWIADEHGLVNLGSVRPSGAEIFGHLNFRNPNDRRTWTACPGASMMAVIGRITITPYEEEDMTACIIQLEEDAPAFKTYLWRPGKSLIHMKDAAQREQTAALYDINATPVTVKKSTLDSLAR